MLQANEALQLQLKELNGVVERVVQTSLGLPAPRAGQKGGGDKLPGAFPAQAKPGSKAQRPTKPGGAKPAK